MVTQIQLGNFFNQNGKTVLGGSNSGIDTESLIKGLVDARRVPATKLEEKIDLNTKKTAALSELRSLLDGFRDAANFLRSPPGVQNAADNIFQYRSSTISSNTAVAGNNYFTATVEPGTSTQNYVIDNISQLAQATKQETGNFAIASLDDQVVFGVPAPGQFGAGLITVNGADITLDTGDTMREVMDKFNAVRDTTGISVTALQVSPGNFKMIFTATETGTSSAFDMSSPLTVTADVSGALANVTFTTTQAAQNAMFEIDDIAIVRESNNIDDLIDGVTLNLKSTTTAAPATRIELSIVPDAELVKTGITNFINAYNDFRLFVSRQTELTASGTPAEDALLAGNPTLRSVLAQVTLELSRSVAGIAGTDPSRLADIGIKFSDYPGDEETPFTRNILTMDEAKLDSAISTGFDDVRRIFEFDFSSNVQELQVFSRTNALDVQDMTVDIDTGLGTYTASFLDGGVPTVVNLTASPISGGGYTLTGPAGSKLEGLVMIYSGAAIASATVHVTQGIGDRLFNAIDGFLDDDTGQLAIEIDNIDSTNTRYQSEIDKIDAAIERYRQDLLDKFASLEAALSKVNTLLQSLDAQAQAQNNN